jgi:alpha-tubulin suppressor-like RCC1 family protein
VLTGGAVRCWGSRTYGQLGNGDDEVLSTAPVPVGALEPAADVSSGGSFGCALLQTTRVRCWGQNDTLQLGNTAVVGGSASPVPVLHYTPGAPSSHREELRNVVALETGTGHACALLTSATMRCWGANNSGQIGVGSSGGTREPTSPSGIFGAVDISAGGANSCAVLDDGTARCWGLGGWRIGSGTMPFTSAPTPLQVAGLTDATSIDTGQHHTCAVRTGGRVSCWGVDDGNQGVLGQSVFLGSNVPLEIANLEGVVDVAAGGRHNCALLADGTVRCWGANDRGQLGNGWNTTARSFVPVPVIGLEGAVALTAGGDHSCAVLADGSARCWGSNSHGQLGNGSRDLSRAPVEVLAPGVLTDIDAGPQHTCAVAADGGSWCWGANGSRQLGTGASFTSPPVQVVGFP